MGWATAVRGEGGEGGESVFGPRRRRHCHGRVCHSPRLLVAARGGLAGGRRVSEESPRPFDLLGGAAARVEEEARALPASAGLAVAGSVLRRPPRPARGSRHQRRLRVHVQSECPVEARGGEVRGKERAAAPVPDRRAVGDDFAVALRFSANS